MALSNEIDLSVEQLPQNPIILTPKDDADYNNLINKPKINNVTLVGNKTSSELGLASDEQGAKADSAVQPENLSVYRTSEDQDIIDATKQDTITDLATIRSGASAGATAVQPDDLATVATSGSYADLTNKPTIPTVDSALSSTSTNAIQNKVVNTALAEKANAIHTHASDDITGLATVATSGMYSDLTGKPGAATVDTLGLVKPDGTTITVTADGVISAEGGSGFDFEGTKAEFGAAVAAGTITADSVSLITDDVSGDNVATKAELQAVDTSKADTNLGNVPSNYDYIVESYNDGANWYRKYKSGWVEQGGYYTGGNQTKTLLVPMANTNYTCLSACGSKGGVNWNGNPITIYRNSTTYISLNTYGNYTDCTGWWEVKGQAAS